MDALAEILLANGSVEKAAPPDILVHGDAGYEMAAINQSRFYLLSGITCEYSVFESRAEATAYAQARGIRKICFVNTDHEIVDL